MIIKGKIWKYGDNVNTDVIFPGKYTYAITDYQEMAKYALADLDPEFASKVQPGDIIVAGWNMGCGSSREQAAISIKYAGAGAIIAKSFGRIFFRNCINQGLPALQCRPAVDDAQHGNTLQINLSSGEIINLSSGKKYVFSPLHPKILEIMDAGGLFPYVQKKLSETGNQ